MKLYIYDNYYSFSDIGDDHLRFGSKLIQILKRYWPAAPTSQFFFNIAN